MMAASDFSEAELKLFAALDEDYLHLCNNINDPVGLWRMFVEDEFVKVCVNQSQGDSGHYLTRPQVVLGRGYNALLKCNPYRRTEEFDKLLKF